MTLNIKVILCMFITKIVTYKWKEIILKGLHVLTTGEHDCILSIMKSMGELNPNVTL